MAAQQPSITVDSKQKTVTIVMPLQDPTPSKSGKTLVIATTQGNRPTASTFRHDGKDYPLTMGVNVYFANPNRD